MKNDKSLKALFGDSSGGGEVGGGRRCYGGLNGNG